MVSNYSQWKWHVYILECQDGLYYTGMTWNMDIRMQQHADGLGGKFTARHGFKELKYVEEFSSVEEARLREHQLKDFSRKKKEALWGYSSQQASNNNEKVLIVGKDQDDNGVVIDRKVKVKSGQ